MMKREDVKVATAHIIADYLREDESRLNECLMAIQGEIDDWAESGNSTAEVSDINVCLSVPRTPYNIRGAIQILIEELRDLDGTELTVVFAGYDLSSS